MQTRSARPIVHRSIDHGARQDKTLPQNKQPERPEERGAAEVIATTAAVVSAIPPAIKVVGQVKDKLKK